MSPQSSRPKPKYRESKETYNQKYVTRVASSPIASEELETVEGHLGDIFHENGSVSLCCHPSFRPYWQRYTLMAPAPQHEDGVTVYQYADISDYANKETAVYFVSGGSNETDHRHGYTDRHLGFYINRKWHVLHDGRPNLQRYRFAAKALRVPESEATDWSIISLVAAHRRLCDAMEARIGGEVTWREHGLPLCHLFRAVFVVADDLVLPEECPVQPGPDYTGPEEDWKVRTAWLEWLMPECAVLIVRTRDDAHLSRPVSFERLIGEGKTVPLGLEERKLAQESSVVRVKIDVALRFLFDLQAEEEAAIPDLQQKSSMITEERKRACHAWVESVLQYGSLEEVGVDGNHFA
ncbi:hypothetical protein M426DRAFT_14353 [Hypoxylon sp. CI-4A]|nr:hypothetical protein M426DRAFT_14353 [Hypoxylon sp. CI-4A]